LVVAVREAEEGGSKGDAGEIGEGFGFVVEETEGEEDSSGCWYIVVGIGRTQIRSRNRLC